MTALIFQLCDEDVWICMDTLVSRGREGVQGAGDPLCYSSKLYLVPHLQATLCGTGCAELIVRWYATINTRLVVDQLSMLDQLAQCELPRLWQELSPPAEFTATIYHFGFLLEENRFAGFKYDSAKQFQSERLQYCLGMKPSSVVSDLGHEAIWDLLERKPLPDGFVELVMRMRVLDEAPSNPVKVGIGGQIQCLRMTRESYYLETLASFVDLPSQYKVMLSQCDRVKQS